MKVKAIPNVYINVDERGRKIVSEIKQARPENNGIPAEWWRCGYAFCTQFNNGYYHIYIIEKNPFYGIVLQEYYINRKGVLVEGRHHYNVPTKQSLSDWCVERNIKF